MKEVENVLRILKEARAAIDEKDPYKIKQLSNQTIHTATISQDGDNLVVAVLVYALSKVFEREHYQRIDGWEEFYAALVRNLDAAVKNLEMGRLEQCRIYIGRIRNSLNKISGDLKNYIKDVFYKAEINKAFKLYEHGLSSEKVARLLGVSLWDLSTYIGQSSISEAFATETIPIEKRVKVAEEILS